MKIFNVLVNDRHCNPEVCNFKDKDDAVAFAREIATECCGELKDLEEQQIEDWILFIQYSPEGDYVSVMEGELK